MTPLPTYSKRELVNAFGTCIATLFCSAGCEFQQPTPNPDIAPVCGVVTLNGQPLPKVDLTFESLTARPSSGMTDAKGRYELQYDQWNKGALIGGHIVHIVRLREPGSGTRPKPLPERYNTKSELRVRVQPGENVFDFHLIDDEDETPPATP